MGRKTLFAGLISIIIPCVIYFIIPKVKKHSGAVLSFFLIIYIIGMFYLTLGSRHTGMQNINLSLFWSYKRFRQADVRWQIYMNIFLFIPFGFMLSYLLSDKTHWNSAIVLCATAIAGFALSLFIESMQYYNGLGLCELDDILNNTIGAVSGYGLLRILAFVQRRSDEKKWY